MYDHWLDWMTNAKASDKVKVFQNGFSIQPFENENYK